MRDKVCKVHSICCYSILYILLSLFLCLLPVQSVNHCFLYGREEQDKMFVSATSTTSRALRGRMINMRMVTSPAVVSASSSSSSSFSFPSVHNRFMSNNASVDPDSEGNGLLKTALHGFHKEMLKGKMVPFAGYELPVFYQTPNGGVLKEHLHCRTKASVFDVSHMGQLRWTGKDRMRFIEKCVVGDIQGLNAGEAKLSLITNQSGGIIDDTIISNASEDYTFMVVNGATKFGDMEHFDEQLENFDGEVQ